MKIIQSYFLRHARTPLLLFLGALSLLALLTQSLSTIDLIIENRQSAGTFLYITLLALPQLFGIIMPLAVSMAVLYSLNRLNIDRELVVTKASGFSPWQITSPVLRIATVALIAHLIINLFVQPYSFRKMREALLDVRTDIAVRMVQAGEFNEPMPGLTIYASEILPSGQMTDVLIYDERSADTPITYVAKKGVVSTFNGRTSFTLIDGNVHYTRENGEMDITNYTSNTYDLTDLITIDPVLHFKTSDRYLYELLHPEPAIYANQSWVDEYRAEAHERLSAPLYNIALTLLACAFLVRGEHKKLGYGHRIAVAAVLGFGIRLFGFAVTSAAEEDPSINWIQYAVPLFVTLIATWYLLDPRRAQTIFNIRGFFKEFP